MQLQQDIQIKQNEAQRETRKKEKLERELRAARTEQDAKNSEIKTLNQQIERFKREIQNLETTNKDHRVMNHLFFVHENVEIV